MAEAVKRSEVRSSGWRKPTCWCSAARLVGLHLFVRLILNQTLVTPRSPFNR